MNKRIWNFELEIGENDDAFFKQMPSDRIDAGSLKTMIMDILFANGFEGRIRQLAFRQHMTEDFGDYKPTAKPVEVQPDPPKA